MKAPIPALSLSHLEDALALHGPDLAAWPEDLRMGAQALMAADPAARALHGQAMELERLLTTALDGQPTAEDEAIARRVATRLRAAPLPTQPRPWRERAENWLAALGLRPAWPGVAALAGMAMLGFLLGGHLVEMGGVYGFSLSSPAPTRLADADVSGIMFDPDPLAENGL
ncbi:hypothetical protein GCM10007301_21070 [Azorhizobium oxalatiphilum]|uniref:Uncharacterized protein n=1 Tax=Azorhizobium oxalatiphilum TaxID=980631 RepID=A0A917BZ53_9HYPH|nr:hypothetical protein [Azorhizobium oxalatiphilum]GGF61067.1 hypothetical protein GCM10007301_21070 [Azorhizobium oxalatiphilum]